MPESKLNTDDPVLFSLFQQGDRAAADTIFLQHVRSLCFFIERLTGSLPDAQDIVADTFVKLLERRSQFRDLDNVRAFLYRTARNAAINLYHEQTRHAKTHRDIGYLARPEEVRENWLDNELIRIEVLGDIYREIEELPGKCREIFKAIFIRGLSNEEIADQMGIAIQTVRSQKSRALELLRAKLLKKGQWVPLLYLLEILSGHS